MRPISLLSSYFAFIFLGGAFLAPLLYQSAQVVLGGSETFRELVDQPFHRYVNRSLLFLALIGLWPFLRGLGVRTWSDLGFTPISKHGAQVWYGFLVGFCSLATLALLTVTFGVRKLEFRHTGLEFFWDLFGATATAIVVAVLEETLFRGALFGTLRKRHPWPLALFLSSALYALFHFFAKVDSPESVTAFSGLATLAGMLRGFVDFQALVPGFFNLLIAGIILGLALQRTGNLYFSIGLHAGWIFWFRSYGLVTRKAPGADLWFWGGRKMTDGWIATIVLVIVFSFLFARYKNENRRTDAS